MTKADLIHQVANSNQHLTVKEAELIVNLIFDSMTEALAKGDRIEIRGFGSFKVKHREAREGRNPRTGVPVRIPSKRYPAFKIGRKLEKMINPENS